MEKYEIFAYENFFFYSTQWFVWSDVVNKHTHKHAVKLKHKHTGA